MSNKFLAWCAKRVLVIVAAVWLAGCVSSNAGNVYSRDETKRAFEVKMGVIEHIRPVQIEGTKSHIGTAAGAVVGGLAGRGVGGGTGRDVATAAGAIVGGLAGAGAEELATRRSGFEYVVKLDNGQTLAVVQEDGGEQFGAGERVRVLENGGALRVAR